MKKIVGFLTITILTTVSTIGTHDNAGDYGQTPAFTSDERYLDIFPLTKNNFTASVLKHKDPWIVIFHNGSMVRGWKSMAVSLRGVIWVGMININTEVELLTDLDYKEGSDPVGRVYPYGSKKTKQEKWKAVKNPNEARQLAVNSLPNKVQKTKGKDIQGFLMDSFTTSPSRFPILLLTDELETPALFKGLANRFNKYFHFGCIIQPTFMDYRHLGMEDDFLETPAILVLLPRKVDQKLTDKLEFNAIHYNERKMGKMDYPNVMQFLFAVNNQYRHWLPGDNQSNSKEASEMSDIIEIEKLRFNILNEGDDKTNSEQKPSFRQQMSFKPDTIQGARDEL